MNGKPQTFCASLGSRMGLDAAGASRVGSSEPIQNLAARTADDWNCDRLRLQIQKSLTGEVLGCACRRCLTLLT